MTDFQNDMYRRYLASGQAEKAEAFRQAGGPARRRAGADRSRGAGGGGTARLLRYVPERYSIYLPLKRDQAREEPEPDGGGPNRGPRERAHGKTVKLLPAEPPCWAGRSPGSGTAARAAETRLGLLADSRMRKGKIMCHALFDALWRGKPKARRKRDALYEWLAGQMGLPLADCHFGYFDLQQLRQAYRLLSDVQGLPMRYDNRGRIFFEERRSA